MMNGEAQEEFDWNAKPPAAERGDSEAVTEKIRKLLRMRRGGTDEEIATALALAQRLAARHGIDLSGIDPDEDQQQPITHLDAKTAARLQSEVKYSGMLCDQFFSVRLLIRSSYREHRITLIGEQHDIDIATYVFAFLIGEFRRAWKQAPKRLKNRKAFMWGMYLGLSTKLRLEREDIEASNSDALVVIGDKLARCNAYLGEHWPEIITENQKPKSKAEAAEMHGFRAGRNTHVRKGVRGGGNKAKAITGGHHG